MDWARRVSIRRGEFSTIVLHNRGCVRVLCRVSRLFRFSGLSIFLLLRSYSRAGIAYLPCVCTFRRVFPLS